VRGMPRNTSSDPLKRSGRYRKGEENVFVAGSDQDLSTTVQSLSEPGGEEFSKLQALCLRKMDALDSDGCFWPRKGRNE